LRQASKLDHGEPRTWRKMKDYKNEPIMNTEGR
jgi:hypothetical protein